MKRMCCRMMKQEKKGFYYVSLVGILFLSLIPITPIISYGILLYHTITKDPEAVGYVVMFLTLPVLVFALVTMTFVGVAYITLRQSLKKKQKQMGIWHIVIGGVNVVLLPIYIYCIQFILEMMVSTSFSGGYIWQQSGFHPLNLLYATYSIGPVLILVGGILGLVDNKQTERNKE